MPRYGKSAQESVHQAMHKMKKGKLESGRSGIKVRSRKQAIAIGLSEAREKGAKVPTKGRAGSTRHASPTRRSTASSSSSRRKH